jgi:hypothetical protein
MPIQVIAPDTSRAQQQLLQIQLLGQIAGQAGQAFEARRLLAERQGERDALVSALMSGAPVDPGAAMPVPGAGPVELPGAGLTASGDLAPATIPASAPTPSPAPGLGGLSREQLAGLPDAALGQLFAQRYAPPETISPYQQAQLDISRQGQELERQELGLRRDQFSSEQEFNRAKLALDERKLAADQATTGQAKLSDIGSFRGQYTGLSEDFIKLRDAYGKLRAGVQDPSAAGDVALVSGYMKMIDPQSVVREGEYATAATAAGVPEIIRGYWNRLVNGERLTAAQRSDFAKQAHALFAAQRDQQEQLQSAYRGIAGRTIPGVDPGDVVPDFVGKSREWAPVIGQPSAAEAASPIGPAMGAAQETFEELVNRYAR